MLRGILQKNLRNILFLLVILSVFIGAIFVRPPDENNIESSPLIHPKVFLNAPNQVYNIPPITAEDHIWGSPNAPVKIIEYSDTECPSCKRNYFNMRSIFNQYRDDIALVYRYNTLDHLYSQSRKEAEALECAAVVGEEGAFWLLLEEVYTNTQSEDSLDLSSLPEFMDNIGVDREAFERCLENGDTIEIVEQGNREAAQAGLESTPSMVIFWPDGERRSLIVGARSPETMVAALGYILGRETNPINTTKTDPDEEDSYSK